MTSTPTSGPTSGDTSWPGYRFELRGDAHWVPVPLELPGDAGDWAAEVVAEGLQVRGLTENEAVRTLYVQSLAAFAERVTARDREGAALVGVYLLLPDTDLVPVTAAELEVVAVEPGIGPEQFADVLVLPEAQRFAEPAVTTVASAHGDAVKVEQLVVEGEEGTDQGVATAVAYVWPGPVADTLLVLHAYFGSPVDGELHGDRLDELAGTLSVQEVAG